MLHTGKQIFVLTIAEQNLLKHRCISQLSKKIQRDECAFTMDLYCCVTHLLAITAGKLACLSLCLTVSSAMKWKTYSKQKLAAKRLHETGPWCYDFEIICYQKIYFKGILWLLVIHIQVRLWLSAMGAWCTDEVLLSSLKNLDPDI